MGAFSRGYADPGHVGVSRNIAATGGRSVSRAGAATKPAANTGPQGASSDIYELLNPSITQSGRRTDKPVELYPTWQRRGEGRNVIQQGYALTVNTLAGLGWAERQWIAAGQQLEVASGSLNIHYDDVALPFATESYEVNQAELHGSTTPGFYGVLSTVFKGVAVWCYRFHQTLYGETSVTNPTPRTIAGFSDGAGITALTTAIIDGTECLLVSLLSNTYAVSGLDPYSIHTFTGAMPVNGAQYLQVPLPKQPILLRYGGAFVMLRSDWSTPGGVPTSAQLLTNQTNVVRSSGTLVGLGRLGDRPAQVAWLEYNFKLATTNVYGMEFSDSMP
jgi:hypothetical protein